VISNLIVAYEVGRKSILFLFGRAKHVFALAFRHVGFLEIASDFFTEAAVLCFVFPILDRIVADKPISVGWVGISFGLALLFLFFAGILSMLKHGLNLQFRNNLSPSTTTE
jgi:hypothetical protein